MGNVGPQLIGSVYRIVWTDPPELTDFESLVVQGGAIARFPSPEAQRVMDGISVYRTISQARRTARKRPPWLGRGFIARLDIPPGAQYRLERTMKSAGHYTLWADPASIMSWVAEVYPVIELEDVHDGL